MALFGILIIDKPGGWTSRDVVNRVERLLRPARCGHAGTLDPLASGVLVVCVGRATRLIQYVQRMRKRYRATFLFGRRSPTDDIEGDVTLIASAPVPSRAEVEAALPQYIGEIEQRPPEYSAVKVSGRRAYELARRGEKVDLGARPVVIHQLSIARYEYPELELEIECGSGTYVRSLGRDLAAALGTTAVMSKLERTAIGRFHIDDAIEPDELSTETLPQSLQPALAAVAELPRVTLNDSQLGELRHGRPIAKRQAATTADEWAAVDASGQLVAIVREKRAGELWPIINLGG